MDCEAFENYLVNAQGGESPPGRRQAADSHLAACPECRDLAARLQRLEHALERHIQPVALPADFERKLHLRLASAAAVRSPEQLAERKRQMQAEFEQGIAQLDWASLVGGWLENWGALALLGAVAGFVVCYLVAWLAPLAGSSVAGLPPQYLLYALTSAVLFSAIGLVSAFFRPLNQA